jgi:RNA polymerase sigma-70 factor, ECF subfamily
MHIAWDAYTNELRNFIKRRINDPMDADDVLQDVLLKAYRHQDQLTAESNIRAWLYQIARNTIIDFYRQQRPAVAPLDDYFDVLPNPHDGTAPNAEIIDCVLSLVHDLPEKYRQALVAADLYEIPQNLLSDQLGLSYSGTKSRVQRGREQLRQMLEIRCQVEVDQYKAMHCTPQSEICCA